MATPMPVRKIPTYGVKEEEVEDLASRLRGGHQEFQRPPPREPEVKPITPKPPKRVF